LEARRPINLVLEGGGVKAIAHLGAFGVLEREGLKPVSVASASAGAIVGALIAAGFGAVEMRELLLGLDWRGLLDGPRSWWRRLVVHSLTWGIHRGEKLRHWLDEALARKGVETFGDLEPGSLKVVVADVSRGRIAVLPDQLSAYGLEAAAFPVSLAVRASAAIPAFFRPVRVRARGRAHYWVDGGLLSNFPAWLYPASSEHPTVGVLLEERGSGRHREIRSVVDYYEAVFAAKMGSGRDLVGAGATAAAIIRVPVGDVRATDFDLDDETAEWLIRQGEEAAEREINSERSFAP
jgi:NTE family protein